MILSIITINYNNIEGLKATFESVIRQTFTDYEWIIIDGGSTDGSREFIEQNQDKFSFWCSEPDGGIYQAMNKGVAYAHGEFISFLNSGDCYHESTTLQQVFASAHRGDILYGDVIFIEKDKKRHHTYPDFISFNWLSSYTINHQSSFTRRKIFDSLLFDVKYKMLADRKFWMQSMLKGYIFEHLPFFVSDYDYTGFSTTNQDKWNSELEQIRKEVIPIGLKSNLQNGMIFESHSDLRKAYSILQKHGICRRLLHWSISCLSRFQ